MINECLLLAKGTNDYVHEDMIIIFFCYKHLVD